MPDKMVLCLILLAMFACTSALFDILFRWCDEFIAHKKDGKRFVFTIVPRGTGEANAERGWK